jgi:hypothetical protein
MRKLQVNTTTRVWIALCGLMLAGGAIQTDAQTPGAHPGYLRSIRNLREARGLLQGNFTKPAHIQAAAAALPEINAAIGDLKNASNLDEKSLGEVPPPDNTMLPEGRFHKAADLLQRAHHDASGAESDPAAVPYQDGALRHIDAASAAVAKAL